MEVWHNPVVLKVLNGTLNGTENLCQTCRYAIITTEAQTNHKRTVCNVSFPIVVVKRPLAQCNKYDDRTKPSLGDMMEIAWTLQTGSNRKVGFLSPDELRERERRNGDGGQGRPPVGF